MSSRRKSANVQKFIEQKDFNQAYEMASLGITDSDFQNLGYEALSNGEFDIAIRCFQRTEQLDFLDLASKYQKLSHSNQLNLTLLQAEVLAYQQKYHEAG